MVLDAEKNGMLKKGDRIVEATSGNTGIGLALASAVRGYEVTIAMPEKMSTEKANVLKGLGAHIIRTPTECSFDHPESHISVSRNMESQGAVLIDQYKSPSNPIGNKHFIFSFLSAGSCNVCVCSNVKMRLGVCCLATFWSQNS